MCSRNLFNSKCICCLRQQRVQNLNDLRDDKWDTCGVAWNSWFLGIRSSLHVYMHRMLSCMHKNGIVNHAKNIVTCLKRNLPKYRDTMILRTIFSSINVLFCYVATIIHCNSCLALHYEQASVYRCNFSSSYQHKCLKSMHWRTVQGCT